MFSLSVFLSTIYLVLNLLPDLLFPPVLLDSNQIMYRVMPSNTDKLRDKSKGDDVHDHEHYGISLHDRSDHRLVVAVTLRVFSLIVNAFWVARHSYSVSCCANAFGDPNCS